MKRIILLLALLCAAAAAIAQPSTRIRVSQIRGPADTSVSQYIHARGDTVTWKQVTGDTATFLFQDSILVYFHEGMEAGRDTIRAGGNPGTVTSVATGLGLSGGPITSAGTISADTAVLATQSGLAALTGANAVNRAGNQFKLGGPLIEATTISGDFLLTRSGARNSTYLFDVNNTGSSSTGIRATGTNRGILARGNGTFAVQAESTSTPLLGINTSTGNTGGVVSGLNLQRGGSFNGAVGNGISIAFFGRSDTNTALQAATIRSAMTDVTEATSAASLDFFTRFNNSIASRRMSLAGSGQLTLDGYTTNNFVGTGWGRLVVQSGGLIVVDTTSASAGSPDQDLSLTGTGVAEIGITGGDGIFAAQESGLAIRASGDTLWLASMPGAVDSVGMTDSVTIAPIDLMASGKRGEAIVRIDMTAYSDTTKLAAFPTPSNPYDGGVYTFHFTEIAAVAKIDFPASFLDQTGGLLDADGHLRLEADDFLTCYYHKSEYWCGLLGAASQGGGSGTWLKPELESGGYVKIDMKDGDDKSGVLEFNITSPNISGFVDTLVRFVADSLSDDAVVIMSEWATNNPGAGSTEAWNIYSTDGVLQIQTTRNGGSGQGLKYATDYSAGYTSRSLVDKAYVDAAVGSGGGLDTASLTFRYVSAQSNTSLAIPAGAKSVEIHAIGGGGGGGGGRRGAGGTTRLGGGGGGGGGYSWGTFSIADDLQGASTLFFSVGAGGASGARATTNDTNGVAGGDGGQTFVGTTSGPGSVFIRAYGGTGGQGSTNGNGGSTIIGSLMSGGQGGTSAVGVLNSAFSATTSGGGAGGIITDSDTFVDGGSAGQASMGIYSLLPGGSDPNYSGQTPTLLQGPKFGQGGSGGGARNNGNSPGGNGVRGGGGGGGGPSLNGNNSGQGGIGGAGYLLITFYF
jgi:hypothetical protein